MRRDTSWALVTGVQTWSLPIWRVVEPWYRAAELALVPPMQLWFNWRLEGLEKIPLEGPAIVAGNHLSYVDPLAHGYFVVKAGRRPRFLAKQELFDAPLVGTVLRGAHQISVERGTGEIGRAHV